MIELARRKMRWIRSFVNKPMLHCENNKFDLMKINTSAQKQSQLLQDACTFQRWAHDG